MGNKGGLHTGMRVKCKMEVALVNRLKIDNEIGNMTAMKLRLDLLELLTDEDILEEALAQQPRYRPEPLFSQTGKGYLRSATEEEKAAEIERMKALHERLEQRLKLKTVISEDQQPKLVQ